MSKPTELGRFNAVIFDWDGVLVDSSRNYYRAYELVLHDLGISTTPREIYLREGQPTPEVIAALCADRGVPISREGIKAAVERRREYDVALGRRTFFPGALNLLTRLRNSNYRLAMVTGSSRKSVQLVLGTEQEKYFDAIVTADDVTRPKPDPQPFLIAAQMLRLPPQLCVVVENAPFGIRGAREAGCQVVAITTTLNCEDLVEANIIVRSHQALETLFSGRLQPLISTQNAGHGDL